MGDRYFRVIDKVIGAALPPTFYGAAIEIVRELQAPADVDALLAGRAQSLAPRSRDASRRDGDGAIR